MMRERSLELDGRFVSSSVPLLFSLCFFGSGQRDCEGAMSSDRKEFVENGLTTCDLLSVTISFQVSSSISAYLLHNLSYRDVRKCSQPIFIILLENYSKIPLALNE